jgi:hypothetical protein
MRALWLSHAFAQFALVQFVQTYADTKPTPLPSAPSSVALFDTDGRAIKVEPGKHLIVCMHGKNRHQDSFLA